MPVTFTTIPDSFGEGGANIGDGSPLLVDILKELQAKVLVVEGEISSTQASTDAVTAANAAATAANAAATAATAATIAKRTVTVDHADLTEATSQAVNVGAVLPANAIVLGHELNVTEQFAGEADTTITVGGTDADAIVASTDLDAMTVGKHQGTLGVHYEGKFSGEQLIATFAATALGDLTAGTVTITVWYFVLA